MGRLWTEQRHSLVQANSPCQAEIVYSKDAWMGFTRGYAWGALPGLTKVHNPSLFRRSSSTEYSIVNCHSKGHKQAFLLFFGIDLR